VSTHAEDSSSANPSTERLVLWQRCAAGSGSDADAAECARDAGSRLQAIGGELILRGGHVVVASFHPLELDEVVESALELLATASRPMPDLDVSIGLALGEVLVDGSGVHIGAALDRAAQLAHAVEAGELALDVEASSRAQDRYLFGRSLRRGSASGRVVDRQMPRKRDCRVALSELRAPALPESLVANLDRLEAWTTTADPAPIVLRASQAHAAHELLSCLRAALGPSGYLQLAPHAGALQPLGTLCLALSRDDAGPSFANQGSGAITALARGDAVSRGDAVAALRAACKPTTWIVLEQPRELDALSLGVVAEAVEQSGSTLRLFVVTDDVAIVPSILLRGRQARELSIEPLTAGERAAIAASALGLQPDSSIALRLALFGGETVGEVVQAARTLIGSGDLVLRAGVFEWRREPRAAAPIAVEVLLTESASGLTIAAHRLLEAASVAPPGSPRSLIAGIAALDGLRGEDIEDGFAQLDQEGWYVADRLGGPLEQALRNALRNSMPPARAAELHRFVACVLIERGVATLAPSFGHALLAHHWLEGGRDVEAADALLDAAQAATEQELPRMAVRLASLALSIDPSEETRDRASRVARSADDSARRTLPGTAPSPIAPDAAGPSAPLDAADVARAAIEGAVTAIARGEPEGAEAALDTAIAAGWDRSAAQRLWAVALLARDDVAGAVHVLKQARSGHSDGAHARDAITAALILLQAGEDVDAIRAALEGLASARKQDDARGEAAALLVLSGCYRQLGRAPDAERLAAAADQTLSRL
jgi:hypothetical protein